MTFSISDLAKEVYELNLKQGWHVDRDHSEECRLGMVALIHSEVSEALEDVRNNHVPLSHDPASSYDGVLFKPTGLPSELADIVIRCLDFATWFEVDIREVMKPQLFSPNSIVRPRWTAAALGRLHQIVSDEDINEAIYRCYNIAAQYGVDLEQVILIKHEFNKTRPARHGGKKL